MPKANVGRLERKLRVAGGIVLLAAALFIEWPQAWEGLIGVIGGALLVTGFVRYCPLNHLFGRTPRT
jgi:predicted anti-sigma-YlaC factor YlaD